MEGSAAAPDADVKLEVEISDSALASAAQETKNINAPTKKKKKKSKKEPAKRTLYGEVMYSQEITGRGRGILAARPLKAGEIIVQERSYAQVIFQENQKTICACCCNEASSTFACSK